MFALKSKVKLTKSRTQVCTCDAYIVQFVLKLRLVVVVNVIITITCQVFRSLYKPATVPILMYTVNFKNIFYSHQKNMLTTKYRARTFINQLAKLLYEGL